MNTSVIPFILTVMTAVPLFLSAFFITDSFFERRISKKYIFLFLILEIIVHAVMSLNYVFSLYRGYCVLLSTILFPLLFYKKSTIIKRIGCGIMNMIYIMVMDFSIMAVYFILQGTELTISFSMTRQIYFVIIGYVLYAISIKPVTRIINYFINKSRMFFYQLFLAFVLLAFEIGTVNCMLETDVQKSATYIMHSGESILYVSRFLGFILLDIVIFWILSRLDKSYRIETKIKLNKQKVEMQRKYYTLVEEHFQKSREFAHDFKNHILTVKHLYEKGAGVDAADYVDNALKHMDSTILAESAKKELEIKRNEKIKNMSWSEGEK